jgi:hypothetical protein
MMEGMDGFAGRKGKCVKGSRRRFSRPRLPGWRD